MERPRPLNGPKWKQTEGRLTFVYRFDSEDVPPLRLRLKVEINSREHLSVYGVAGLPFSASSRWFAGKSEITTYALDELLGTKTRALYQRKKSRDLFDLAIALESGTRRGKARIACDRVRLARCLSEAFRSDPRNLCWPPSDVSAHCL